MSVLYYGNDVKGDRRERGIELVHGHLKLHGWDRMQGWGKKEYGWKERFFSFEMIDPFKS